MSERLAALDREMTKLRQQNSEMATALAAARQRVQDLELARDTALDRIEWAIDSLHSVLEPEH